MKVEIVTPIEWKKHYMKESYTKTFGAERPPDLERCSFALLAINDENVPVGFVTCHELDSETIYWQFGGAFDSIKKTFQIINYYVGFITYCRERYQRIRTRIENTNLSMLKLALKCGFLIVGTLNVNNKIYLELTHG